MRLPVRARLTLVSGGLMAVLLVALGAFLYLRLKTDLVAAVDAGLRSRAEALVVGGGVGSLPAGGILGEKDESFAQVQGIDGSVIESSAGLRAEPLLAREIVASLREAQFFETEVQTSEEPVPARLLAVPTAGGRVVVVGASLEDQEDALARLMILLAVGGPIAIALASGVGWLVAGAALRPVDRMRAEADAVSASEPGRRLPVPGTRDELARLGETLNRMLGRLEEAVQRERRFVADASHELRSPLANLKAELELALKGSRSPEELVAALRSAAEETDQMARLAEDLLVLARAEGGPLPVRREDLDVAELLRGVVAGLSGRALERGVLLEPRVDQGLRAMVDGTRVGQAVGNLIDNAMRHTPSGGTVTVEAAKRDDTLRIEIADTGTGFPLPFLPRAFEPFSRPDPARTRPDGGTGLGLAIVRAIAEGHGGTVEAANRPEGGAVVVLSIPLQAS